MTIENLNQLALKKYLLKLHIEDFRTPTDELLGKLEKDVKRFNLNARYNKVIKYNEIFLMDIYGRDLTVCKHTFSIHKLNNGRRVNCLPIITIIDDTEMCFGSVVNGIFSIPSRFFMENR